MNFLASNIACRPLRGNRLTKVGSRGVKERGRLSNDDNDDGSKKVDKKMNLRPFKLYCVYLNSLNLSNVGDFFVELNS